MDESNGEVPQEINSLPPKITRILRFVFLGVVICALLFLYLKFFPNPVVDIVARVKANHYEHVWESQKISNYQYSVNKYNLLDGWGGQIIVVNGTGTGAMAWGSDTTYQNEIGELVSIDNMFEFIRDAISESNWNVSVNYDPLLGYPTSILFYDPFPGTIDGRVSWVVSEFVVLTSK